MNDMILVLPLEQPPVVPTPKPLDSDEAIARAKGSFITLLQGLGLTYAKAEGECLFVQHIGQEVQIEFRSARYNREICARASFKTGIAVLMIVYDGSLERPKPQKSGVIARPSSAPPKPIVAVH